MENKILSYKTPKTWLLIVTIILLVIIAIGCIVIYKLDHPKVEVRYIDRVITNEVRVKEYVSKDIYWYSFLATGYSPNDSTQGTGRIMKSGNEVYEGAIAVDPEVIPLGTKVEIKGLPFGLDGIYIAEDTGGMIQDYHIDVFQESKDRALQINCDVWVRILEELPMGEW